MQWAHTYTISTVSPLPKIKHSARLSSIIIHKPLTTENITTESPLLLSLRGLILSMVWCKRSFTIFSSCSHDLLYLWFWIGKLLPSFLSFHISQKRIWGFWDVLVQSLLSSKHKMFRGIFQFQYKFNQWNLWHNVDYHKKNIQIPLLLPFLSLKTAKIYNGTEGRQSLKYSL